MADKMYKMAIILPLYNEENKVLQVLTEVKDFAKRRKDYYFVFVDDGSTDKTYHILKDNIDSDENIDVIGYSQNRGKGYAIKYGFEHIDAEYYCFTDSDLAYPLELLDTIYTQLQQYDLVIGSRKMGNSLRRPNLVRHILGEGYNRIMRFILGVPFKDSQAGIKGFRKKVVRSVFPKMTIFGFGFDPEILFLAQKEDFTISEIPVKEKASHTYKSCKIKLTKDSLRMFRDLIKVRINNSLKRYG
ncbi:MAG: glycosyltransferase [Thermodesulfovibrionales bacterium]|nr:glycosyltransferase [Thermodesulfovibrionales bacterium]